jgi:hypothetical protein
MNVLSGWTSLLLMMTPALFGADNVLTAREETDGWVLLFDGQSLNGWTSAMPAAAGRAAGAGPGGAQKQPKAPANPAAAPAVGSHPRTCSTPVGQAPADPRSSHWDVVDGTLSPCGDPAGYLTSVASYKDFVLTADFRTGEDTNSGIFIRAPEGSGGYEVQIWKSQPAGYNTGSIVATAKTEQEFKFIPDQWNHYEITAHGDHLVVMLNGIKTLDCHDQQFSTGRIRLQYQKFPIEFKNIKLRTIAH